MNTAKKIGIFIADEYQELEFWYPYLRLQEEGIKPLIIGEEKKTYQSKLGYAATADKAASDVENENFSAIIIPGGYAPDKMRVQQSMLNLVKNTYETDAVVAAVCHAAWVLISAGIVKGKKATCYHSIQDDLKNAGAHYVDEPVVVDGNLITSRQPEDLPVFCESIIKHL